MIFDDLRWIHKGDASHLRPDVGRDFIARNLLLGGHTLAHPVVSDVNTPALLSAVKMGRFARLPSQTDEWTILSDYPDSFVRRTSADGLWLWNLETKGPNGEEWAALAVSLFSLPLDLRVVVMRPSSRWEPFEGLREGAHLKHEHETFWLLVEKIIPAGEALSHLPTVLLCRKTGAGPRYLLVSDVDGAFTDTGVRLDKRLVDLDALLVGYSARGLKHGKTATHETTNQG